MAQIKISELTAATTPLGGDELLEAVQSGSSKKVTLSDVWMVRDTADNFESDNPTLAAGQTGYETDTGLFKFGDGTTAYNDLDYAAALSSGGGGMEIGTIFPYAGTVAPVGSLVCDGSAISRTEYADLFAAIGTTWGSGDGSTTFNIPDLQGAFLRGTGSHDTETMANGGAFAGPAVGAFEDDQMQGHEHSILGRYRDTSNAADPQWKGLNAGGTYNGNQKTDGEISDGTNGTPRTGDETRPFAAGVTYCIKATPATNSGTPLPTYSYSTGWVANSDWTNTEFTVTHGLNTPLSDLVVKFFLSTDGTEENAIETFVSWNRGDTISTLYGVTAFAINDNSLKIQTASNGILFASDADGTVATTFASGASSGYYKVKVYRPEVLATELATTKYDTGWVANSDWTNQEFTITHNLGLPLPELITKFFVSTDGTDENALEVAYGHNGSSNGVGFTVFAIGDNSLKLQTGSNGILYVDDSGTVQLVDTEAWYYRVVVYKPELISSATPAAVKSVSADYTITGRDDSRIIQVTTGASTITVDLPAGSGMIPGDQFTVVKVDSGAGSVTIDAAGSDTINGSGTDSLASQYSSMLLSWTGSYWQIVSEV